LTNSKIHWYQKHIKPFKILHAHTLPKPNKNLIYKNMQIWCRSWKWRSWKRTQYELRRHVVIVIDFACTIETSFWVCKILYQSCLNLCISFPFLCYTHTTRQNNKLIMKKKSIFREFYGSQNLYSIVL